jgi:subtilisin family serine protease
MKAGALLLVGLCVVLAACSPLTPRDHAVAEEVGASDRQILMMLRVPPPHFRPYSDVAPGYEAGTPRGGQRRIAEEIAQHYDVKLVNDWPMPALGVDCFVLEAPNRVASARLLEEIVRDRRVESAQPMYVFHVLAHNDPLFPLQPSARLWHLAEVHKITTGRDVRIAEIDTGVDGDHPDLRGRVAMARDFVGTTPPVGGEAHGTAVAGLIAARADDGIGIAGVAPDAKLLALRACRQQRGQTVATCTSFTLAKALQFALDQDVQVINLSLGGPRDRLLERLLDAGLARHAVIVGAVDPSASNGGFPASHPGVLAVASDGAPYGPAGALVAPGHYIPTTTLSQSWSFVSGSSYAAAQVSGAVALLLERAPAMDSAQVRSALVSGAVSGAIPDQTAMVDVCAAVALTTSACVCNCMVVARDANPNRAY